MTGSQAARTVFLAGAVLAGVTLAETVKHPGRFGKGGTYKRLWAIGVLTLALSVAADWAPQLIVPLSVAVVVGFVLTNPGALSSTVTGTSASAVGASSGGSRKTQGSGGASGTGSFAGSTALIEALRNTPGGFGWGG